MTMTRMQRLAFQTGVKYGLEKKAKLRHVLNMDPEVGMAVGGGALGMGGGALAQYLRNLMTGRKGGYLGSSILGGLAGAGTGYLSKDYMEKIIDQMIDEKLRVGGIGLRGEPYEIPGIFGTTP